MGWGEDGRAASPPERPQGHRSPREPQQPPATTTPTPLFLPLLPGPPHSLPVPFLQTCAGLPVACASCWVSSERRPSGTEERGTLVFTVNIGMVAEGLRATRRGRLDQSALRPQPKT